MSDADAPAPTPAGQGEDSVFIAYSRQDEALVDAVVKVLRARGVRVLWDRDIHGGAKFQQTLAEWIKSATVFVVLLTSHSVLSDEVKNEIRYAKKYRRHRLPLLVEGVMLPLDLELELAITNIVTVSGQGDAEALADLVEGVLRKVGGHGRRQVEARTPEEAPLPVPPPPRAPVFADVPSQPLQKKPKSGTLPGVPMAWVRRVPYLLGALVLAAGIAFGVRACGGPSDDQELAVESSSSGDVVEAATGPVLSCPDGMKLIARGTFDGQVIEDVCMDVTEVAIVAAYHACSGCEAAGGTELSKYCNGNREDRQDHPVNCVSWTQAKTYCERQGARLPTEWEWEWAARGRGQGRTYPWGEEAPTCERAVMDDKAVKASETDGCGEDRTWPVGSKPKGSSRDGLQDMSGNVWEWTSSLSSSGEERIVRGGSWYYVDPDNLRADYRYLDYGPTDRSSNVGFRCARTAARSQ